MRESDYFLLDIWRSGVCPCLFIFKYLLAPAANEMKESAFQALEVTQLQKHNRGNSITHLAFIWALKMAEE